jgi:dolichyl-phosphate beta-glucosyltransferase
MKKAPTQRLDFLNMQMVNERIDLSIIIPAYNEEQRLPKTLESVGKYLQGLDYSYEIIVVDDGSSDRTSQIVKDLQKKIPLLGLIKLSENKGKGFAVRTGILHSKGRFVFFTDADLSTPIEEVQNFLPLLEEGYDVVVGSRRNPNSRVIMSQNKIRRFMGRVYILLNRWLGIVDVVDVTCGFKAFRREAAKKIFKVARLNRFSFDSEVLFLAQAKFKFRWIQVPIEWKDASGSKVNIIRETFVSFLDLIKIKLYDLRGFYKELPQ